MAVPYEEFDQTLLLYQAILQLVAFGVVMFLSAILWVRVKQRKTSEVKLLALAFTLLAISFLAATIPQLFCLFDRSNDLIFGIPLGGGSHLWWTNFSMVLISISSISLFKFMQLVFQKPGNRAFWVYLAANVAFMVWNIYEGVFLYVPGAGSMSLPLSVLFLLIVFYLWASLFRYALQVTRRVEKSIYRTGMYLIAVSAILLIASYLSWVLNVLLPAFRFFAVAYWIFYIATAFLLYVGYILPNWFRRLVDREDRPRKQQGNRQA